LHYDIAYGEPPSDPDGILAGTVLTQRNLRNRVSWSAIYDNGTFGNLDLGNHASATFYTYDIHGNVDTLVQDYLALFGETDFSRFKKITYDYDLISGKVNQVAYQRARPDQFYHRYNYDAENRLTGVQTSHDGWVWENEANYDYYKHGPLTRTVIGQQQVQGIDYAYTVQGWLKGVNGTQVGDGTYDMGEDGKTGSAHSKIARDAYGFSLNYYSGSPWSDYHAIGATGNKFASVLAALSTNAKSLYNGNIAAMAVNIRGIGDAKLYNYKYDQLNRIVEMDAYSGLQSNNTWTPVASDDYKERVSYDANGNILTYLRNGATGVNGLAMDSLTYQYGRNNSGQLINNRLRYVHDRVVDNAYTEDIDSQTPLTLSQVQAEKLDAQTTDNYQYDEIGNLIKDTKEGITAIEWNVYGKIKSITKGSMTITYTYDAAGNRISKEVDPASGPTRKTYYVRDASGNVMSVYEEGGLVNDGNLTQAEVHLYGSSRLGIFKPDVDMTSLAEAPGGLYGFERGKKFFELSNHLGNVLVSITDRKNGVRLSTDTTLVEYYLPDIASANDYYPFGMTMPGRSVHSDKYRYGFNGKEKDQDLHSLTAYDYGFRIYNPALGRFLSVDPLTGQYPELTSYQFAGNSPVTFIDLDGLEMSWRNPVTGEFRAAGPLALPPGTRNSDGWILFGPPIRKPQMASNTPQPIIFKPIIQQGSDNLASLQAAQNRQIATRHTASTTKPRIPRRVEIVSADRRTDYERKVAEDNRLKAEVVSKMMQTPDGQGGMALALTMKSTAETPLSIVQNGYDVYEGIKDGNYRQAVVSGIMLGLDLASSGRANIGTKLEYVFGKATGSAHNIERSTGMLRQLESVGIFDNAQGRSLMRSHLEDVYSGTQGVVQSNGRYLRESLLMGPRGGLKVESVWEGNKLITVKLLGGK
jgi:RHS repeat-associated protein